MKFPSRRLARFRAVLGPSSRAESAWAEHVLVCDPCAEAWLLLLAGEEGCRDGLRLWKRVAKVEAAFLNYCHRREGWLLRGSVCRWEDSRE